MSFSSGTVIKGTSFPSASGDVPSVLRTGPGCWITYGDGRNDSTSSTSVATTNDHAPNTVDRLQRRRGAGTTETFSSNRVTGPTFAGSFARGVSGEGPSRGKRGIVRLA